MTIAGQFLSVFTVTAVYFGQHKLYPDINRLSFPLTTLILVMNFMIHDL